MGIFKDWKLFHKKNGTHSNVLSEYSGQLNVKKMLCCIVYSTRAVMKSRNEPREPREEQVCVHSENLHAILHGVYLLEFETGETTQRLHTCMQRNLINSIVFAYFLSMQTDASFIHAWFVQFHTRDDQARHDWGSLVWISHTFPATFSSRSTAFSVHTALRSPVLDQRPLSPTDCKLPTLDALPLRLLSDA